MEKIKQWLGSERGMKIINVIFIVSLMTRSSIINYVAYVLWIIYLIFSINRTESRAFKNIYSIILLFPAGIIFVNIVLYFLYIR